MEARSVPGRGWAAAERFHDVDPRPWPPLRAAPADHFGRAAGGVRLLPRAGGVRRPQPEAQRSMGQHQAPAWIEPGAGGRDQAAGAGGDARGQQGGGPDQRAGAAGMKGRKIRP